MPSSVQVGAAHVTISARTAAYSQGINKAVAANARLGHSYNAMGAQLRRTATATGRFQASLASSITSAAVTLVGISAIAGTLRAVTTGFLDYDQGLIRVSKTTGIAGAELEALGRSLVAINTKATETGRALAVARDNIFKIAVAVGQAGISNARDVETLVRATAALESSSNLIGSEAVRAITRYLNVTKQGVDRTNAFASAITHLGNNTIATEAELARFGLRIAQNVVSIAKGTDALFLGLAATFVATGIQLEVAGSALQRVYGALQKQASDPVFFRRLADGSGQAADEFEKLRQRLVDGTATAQDYDRAFLAFIKTLGTLAEVSTATAPSRAQFLAGIVGGGESNVRISRVIGALVTQQTALDRNIGLANEGLISQNEHFVEAARAADAYRERLNVVGRQLKDQATIVGGVLVPGLTLLAEQYRFLEVAALAAGVALVSGFSSRRLAAIRRETTRLRDSLQIAQEGVVSSQLGLRPARERQRAAARSRSSVIFAGGVPTAAQTRELNAANRGLARSTAGAEKASRRLFQAQGALARRAGTLRNAFRLIGTGLVAFAGGPVGLALVGIAALAGLFVVLRSRIKEADSSLVDLRKRVTEFTAQETGPQTQAGQLVADLNAQIDAAVARIADAESRLATRGQGTRGDRAGAVNRLIRGGINEDLTLLEELRAAVKEVEDAQAASAESTVAAQTRVRAAYETVASSLLGALESGADLQQSQAETLRNELRLAKARQSAAAMSEVDGRVHLRAAARRIELSNSLATAQEAVFRNQNRIADAERRLSAAIEIRDRIELNSDDRVLADRQVTNIEAQLRALTDVTSQLELQEDVMRSLLVLGVDLALIRRVAVANLAAESAEDDAANRRRVEPARPDLADARRRAADALRAQRRATENVLVLIGQEDEARAAVSARAEAGIRARLEVERAYSMARQQAADAALRAVEELASARARLATTGTGRQEVEQAKEAAAETKEYANEVGRLADAWIAAGMAAQQAAEAAHRTALQDIAADAARLGDILTDVTADGLVKFEDALAAVFRDGKFDVRSLATAIATDLVRALLRVVVTANLARAALAFFPGLAGGGAGGGLGLFHSGGIAGAPRTFRRGAAGIRADETFAVLQRGEEVLTRRDPRHRWNFRASSFDELRTWVAALPRYHSGGVAGGSGGMSAAGRSQGGAPNVRVELVNQTGQPVEIVDDGVRIDGDTLIVGAVLRNLQRNGQLAQTIKLLR